VQPLLITRGYDWQMRTDDSIQDVIVTVTTCYLCYFVAESGGAGVSGVCMCVCRMCVCQQDSLTPKTPTLSLQSVRVRVFFVDVSCVRALTCVCCAHTQEFWRCSRLAFLLRVTDTQRCTQSMPPTCCTGYLCILLSLSVRVRTHACLCICMCAC
jgi:hypothetical protein